MKLPKIYASSVKKRTIDMTLSENPLGCSPCAVQAIKKLSIQDISEYPNTETLILAAAKRFAVSRDQIIAGNGSEQLIKLLAQTFLTTGDTVCIQKGSFSLFTRECLLAGATVSFIDVQRFEKLNKKPKMIFLCNPNNPTGELIPESILEKIIKAFPETIIVIDEANAEFSEVTNIPKALRNTNVLILRTCSKAFGLAGLRIGFSIGNKQLINKLQQAQQPFPISAPSIKICVSALQDNQFLQKTVRFIKKERGQMRRTLQDMGFSVSDSVTNTLFVTTPKATEIINTLNALDVSIIPNSFFPGCLTQGFRIALRSRNINRLFIQKLDTAISSLHLHHDN